METRIYIRPDVDCRGEAHNVPDARRQQAAATGSRVELHRVSKHTQTGAQSGQNMLTRTDQSNVF